jgi:hypothetical protein
VFVFNNEHQMIYSKRPLPSIIDHWLLSDGVLQQQQHTLIDTIGWVRCLLRATQSFSRKTWFRCRQRVSFRATAQTELSR